MNTFIRLLLLLSLSMGDVCCAKPKITLINQKQVDQLKNSYQQQAGQLKTYQQNK